MTRSQKSSDLFLLAGISKGIVTDKEYLQSGWVKRPATRHGQPPQSEGLGIDGSCWRGQAVLLAAKVQDYWGEAEHHGGQEERQPEANISLSVDHANLSTDRADVDHEVEVEIDTGNSGGGINNHSLARFEGFGVRLVVFVLFGNEDGDV